MTNNKPVTIYLVRHGEAKAAWDEDLDPGLSEKRKLQSEELKTDLAQKLSSSFEAISSPLLRAQETAQPLKETLGFDSKH